MFLLIELMEDQMIARCVLLFGLWRFVGLPLWHHIESFPIVAQLLSYVPNLPMPHLPF